jgi:hypothetical protein
MRVVWLLIVQCCVEFVANFVLSAGHELNSHLRVAAVV